MRDVLQDRYGVLGCGVQKVDRYCGSVATASWSVFAVSVSDDALTYVSSFQVIRNGFAKDTFCPAVGAVMIRPLPRVDSSADTRNTRAQRRDMAYAVSQKKVKQADEQSLTVIRPPS